METAAQEQTSLRLGKPLDSRAFASIERTLHLAFNKWDTYVGGEAVLSSQPVIISRRNWTKLQRIAEALAAEMQIEELHILADDSLQRYIGIPRRLRRVLARLKQPRPTVQTMRFDFHPTAEGWRVSEVNSDVPGGWGEATSLPDLFREWYPEFGVPDSALTAWCDALSSLVGSGCVALLSAPGFLEDLQVIYTFHRELSMRGIQSFPIQSPGALNWNSGRCHITSLGVDISAIIRFYQIEWLARLKRSTKWHDLLLSQDPAIVNPTTSLISESKRFPLGFGKVEPTWKMFVSENRDPRFLDSGNWDDWVLKATYSNTGDEIHFCADVPGIARRQLVRTAQRNPLAWVAQRRFNTISFESDKGPLFPCIGVFVVNGRAAGAYARLSRTRIIDGAAMEAPVLIDENEHGMDEG